jgi:hypothetical protein
LLPNSTYREILSNDVHADVGFAGWEAKASTLAAAFIDFPRQHKRQ